MAIPPPLPPPPPPPVVTPGCGEGAYVVFFDWNDVEIRPEAAAILDGAIESWRGCMGSQVLVTGHADRSGQARNNQHVAQHRAGSVEAYLTAHGIPVATIGIVAKGESEPRVETADGVREVQNRRVEIVFSWTDPSTPPLAETAGNPPPTVTP